eukprot:3844305-Prymnesium_polylepis.1
MSNNNKTPLMGKYKGNLATHYKRPNMIVHKAAKQQQGYLGEPLVISGNLITPVQVSHMNTSNVSYTRSAPKVRSTAPIADFIHEDIIQRANDFAQRFLCKEDTYIRTESQMYRLFYDHTRTYTDLTLKVIEQSKDALNPKRSGNPSFEITGIQTPLENVKNLIAVGKDINSKQNTIKTLQIRRDALQQIANISTNLNEAEIIATVANRLKLNHSPRKDAEAEVPQVQRNLAAGRVVRGGAGQPAYDDAVAAVTEARNRGKTAMVNELKAKLGNDATLNQVLKTLRSATISTPTAQAFVTTRHAGAKQLVEYAKRSFANANSQLQELKTEVNALANKKKNIKKNLKKLDPSVLRRAGRSNNSNAGLNTIKYTLISSDNLPIIFMRGASTITHERGTNYSDLGADATDVDVTLTDNVSVHSTVNQNVVGTYTVTYNTVDSRGNAALPVVRTVNVVDTTPPVITVLPGSNGLIGQTVERLNSYTDPGATAVSFVRNADNSTLSEVDVTTVGTYTVIYQCNDAAVNNGVANVAIQKQRVVTVVDTTKPRIALNGPATLTIERLSGYSDQGAEAFDYSSAGVKDEYNEYTSQIVTTNPVNHEVSGTYTVRYNVTDAHGNAADEVTRTVVVQDTTPPVITIVGDDPFILQRLDTYTDPGATALDGDTDLTSSIVVTNLVDNTDAGSSGYKEYSVHYDVQDIAGNSATRKTRTVRVVDTTKPRLFLTGPSDVTVERLDTYVDQGATAFDFSSSGVQDDATNLTSQIVVTNPVDMSTVGDYT